MSDLSSKGWSWGERDMSEDRQERFAAYVEALAEVIGHADRAEPLRDYCRGLLLPGERKSVEPIAAVTAPARVSAKHQSLLHFVANAPWSNERVFSRIQELILPLIERSGAIEAWIIDDTGFPTPCCMDRWHGRTEPDPCSGLCDADVLRAPEIEHSVQHVGRDGHLARLTLVRLEAQPITDDALPSRD